MAWQSDGLQRPQIVADATAKYFEEQGLFGQCIAERCQIAPNFSDTSSKLFADWRVFCDHHGIHHGASKSLGQKLKKAGYADSKIGGKRGWKGISCKHAKQSEGWEDRPAGTDGTDQNVETSTRAHAGASTRQSVRSVLLHPAAITEEVFLMAMCMAPTSGAWC